jgi:hypothetical protein
MGLFWAFQGLTTSLKYRWIPSRMIRIRLAEYGLKNGACYEKVAKMRNRSILVISELRC